MNIASDIKTLHEPMQQWRRHIHQFPETAYAEVNTAAFITQQLEGFGLDVHSGLAGTGVVASLKGRDGNKKIALRADIDALAIEEHNTFSYKSQYAGKMHACGHDGHTAMLLGAAKYLTQTRNFQGVVHFIFQPAEEGRAGAKRMLDEGLFEKFPTDSVYGMHNFPGIAAGHFAVKAGPMMASFDCFEICVTGRATHAAMPHLGNDPIVASAHMITSLQTIVSRTINPDAAAVLSITQVHGGDTWNAIPETVLIRGTWRCFTTAVQEHIKNKICLLVRATGEAYAVHTEISFNPENVGYPVTMNSQKESAIAATVAEAVVGSEQVINNPVASMGSEDFAFMLQEKPGCYVWIGNGTQEGGCLLHSPHYDFNDAILPIGAAYWVKLVETVLSD